MAQVVVFDMDGVLVDSTAPIRACVAHALAVHDLAPASEAEVRALIGPPLHEAFTTLCAHRGRGEDHDLAASCVRAYRRMYAAESLASTTLVPGIAAVVAGLATSSELAVATSKPLAFAQPILERLGLHAHFAVVEGPALDARHEPKSVTLGRVLDALDHDPRDCWMIGDRHHDVAAARAHGIRSIGVTWGYGDRTELERAGADHLAASPHLLPQLLAAR